MLALVSVMYMHCDQRNRGNYKGMFQRSLRDLKPLNVAALAVLLSFNLTNTKKGWTPIKIDFFSSFFVNFFPEIFFEVLNVVVT